MTPDELAERVNENDRDGVRQALAETPGLARERVFGALGTTALICGAHRGFTEIVDMLLAAGADVHSREAASGSIALHWAAEGGHPRIVRTLVERGSELEARDLWYDLTPLGWATVVVWSPQYHEDRAATSVFLLDAGARLDVFSAIALRRPEAVRAISAAEPDALTRRLGPVADAMTPLHLAVAQRQPETAALLLDLGADLEARTASGLTPLALAMSDPANSAVAALLRERGASDDVSAAVATADSEAVASHLAAGTVDRDLATALLFTAVRIGKAEPVELLVRHGADPNARSTRLILEVPTAATPLHVAAMYGRAGSARALLEAGAHPGAGAEDGIATPLHLAAGGGHVETVRTLLAGGADPAARDGSFGATPLGWAEHGNHAEVVELLRARS